MSLHFLVCLASWLLEWFLCASCLGFWNGFCVPRLCLDFGNGFGVPRVLSFGVVASWLWDELGVPQSRLGFGNSFDVPRVLAFCDGLSVPRSRLGFGVDLVCLDRVLALGMVSMCLSSWLLRMVLVYLSSCLRERVCSSENL